jgi:hypothetical protein
MITSANFKVRLAASGDVVAPVVAIRHDRPETGVVRRDHFEHTYFLVSHPDDGFVWVNMEQCRPLDE